MQQRKNVSREFQFVRDKLEKIGALLVESEQGSNLIEIAFMLGCLQNICHENHISFKEDDE